MSKTYTLKTEPAYIEVTPTLFIKYANDCFEAAKFFEKQKEFSPVPYYLYCKGMELLLKAFLFHNKRVELKKLKSKSYGHNLKKLLVKSKEFNLHKTLNITSLEEKELQKASSLYDNPYKAFEYSRVIDAVQGYTNFPKLKILKRLAKKMLKIKNLI